MKKSLPAGISPVMAMLVCRDAAAEIEFCKVTFGASELNVRPGPDGRVTHALLSISGSHVMIEAEWPSLASRAPQFDGSSPVVIFVYVEDVDSTFERAVAAGAKVLMAPQDHVRRRKDQAMVSDREDEIVRTPNQAVQRTAGRSAFQPFVASYPSEQSCTVSPAVDELPGAAR